MSRYRIEICCEPKRGHYWRLCRRAGTVIATSPRYARRSTALRGALRLADGLRFVRVEERLL
ncbi:MAG: YegP family protein [Xanthomonadales bacterium]|nr:YegP family protein [Xanthomonadales bacterium]